MFEITKYKKSNVKLSIRLPENMSFNNVIVSCIQNSLDEIDLDKYKDVILQDNKKDKITL